MNPTKTALTVAAAGTVLGLGGLGVIAIPADAGEQPPALPAISAQKLVASALQADPAAFQGTVEVDNNLGIPALPGGSDMPSLDFESATVYSDGNGAGRVAVHDGTDEFTAVRQGRTLWTYDSAENSASKTVLPDRPHNGHSTDAPKATLADPAQAASTLLATASESSKVTVDGTANVAQRPAYELVLTPKPTEKTLLREVRVAIDSETRMPLGLSVMVNGTTEPALRIGFTDIRFGPQPERLFDFTPPDSADVTTREPSAERGEQAAEQAGKATRSVHTVGDGWDTVVLGKLGDEVLAGTRSAPDSQHGRLDPRRLLEQVGEKVHGPFGSGYLIGLNGGNVLITDDGRIAAGAVPQQVLEQTLGAK